MSNLSDLLPAGGGAKVITATASGNLATGQTVILQSDGTVKAVAEVAHSENIGSAVTYGASNQTEYPAVVFDPDSNKVIVAYRDNGNSNYGTARVGTVSGNSISFGTAVVFQSSGTNHVDASYDTGEDKVLIAYQSYDEGNGPAKAIVGTVSGTSISFGSALEVEGNQSLYVNVAYSPDAAKHMIIYADGGNSNRGAARLLTVSGTSVTRTNPEEVFESNSVSDPMAVFYDTTNDKFVVVYNDNNTRGRAKVGTVSGSSISFGSGEAFSPASDTAEDIVATFDSNLNKIVVAYQDYDNSRRGVAVVGEVSGTSISFGTGVVFSSNIVDVHSIVFDSVANKVVIQYRDQNNSDYGYYVVGTPTAGNSISYATPVAITNYNNNFGGSAFDTNAGRTVIALSDSTNNRGKAYVLQLAGASTNSSDFVGITNQAINNSASGEVVVEGGVITNGSLLSPITTASYGSEAVYNTGNSRYPAIVYDTANDKIVIAYADYGDSNKGKAIVGTVSGTSISYGSPVEFNSASTDYVTAVFDASAGKVVIGYRDVGNSSYGTARVGTVSGTSISFGTEVVLESASSAYLEASYDTNASKTLFVYSDGGNSDVLTANVGTVSGTSISFGGASALSSDTAIYIAIAYDSTAQKHVVFFANNSNSNRGDACVVTISGTSMSVGSFTTGVAANAFRTAVAYDANANKSVIFFSDADNSNIGKAIIGTVSGTSISVGTEVTWNSTNVGFHGTPAFYDSTTNKIIIGYSDTDDSNKGKTKIGTVDGDTITFGDAAVFNSTSTSGGEIAITKDTDNNKIVIAFKDNGNSNYGTGIVGTLSSGVPNFTIGSTYYVQDDGTLSTTSSSVTAGKAIANTTLLLKG
tara:strand:- start:46 stop:2637 length:2592 start_codon:yes stop_codon:yes gene_type:complete